MQVNLNEGRLHVICNYTCLKETQNQMQGYLLLVIIKCENKDLRERCVMKKIGLIFILMLLLLSACNFPGVTPKTDEPGMIATRVAQTLAAGQINTTTPPTEAIPTSSIPTESLGTITPTVTPTLTPTATSAPENPKLTLGTPAYFNTFSSGSDFGLSSPYVDDAVRLSVHDGVLEFTSLGVNYGRRFQLTYPKPKDLYLEGTFTAISCSGYDHYGLVLRAPNYNDGYGYYIGVSCNGQFTAEKWDSGGISTILDWTADDNILTGAGQTNRLGVWLKGDQMKLYANGVLIKEITDSSFSTGGHFGIYGGAVDSGNFSFDVNEISQWDLP
jgi:hypothetical protein